MPRIVVSERVCEMLRQHVLRELRGAAQHKENGLLDIEISGALYDELKAQQFPGETLNAVVLRYLPTRTGGRR